MNKTPRWITWGMGIIILATVISSSPRWVPALMLSEGLDIPQSWLPWWTSFSLLLNMAMPAVEALALSFIFYARSRISGKGSTVLLLLASASIASFVFTLAPFITASILSTTIQDILTPEHIRENWLGLLWGTAVILTTAIPAAAVGYAHGQFEIGDKQPEKNTNNNIDINEILTQSQTAFEARRKLEKLLTDQLPSIMELEAMRQRRINNE